jgi:arginyl-tRNA synthetase
MVKQQLEKDLKKAVEELGYDSSDTLLSISPNPDFGDYSTNGALQLAKQKSEKGKQPASPSAKRGESPQEIAKEILEKLGKPEYLEKTEIAGPGFINFFIKPEAVSKQVQEILQKGEDFSKNNHGENQKIQVEFISANPTGPLTLANGRGGAVGDALANVLETSGFKVDREYYFNDSGNQVRILAESVKAAAGKVSPQENHYQGDYVKELAEKFKDDLGMDSQELGHKLAVYLMEHEIKPALERFGLEYDEFYSEASLYGEGGKIDQALKLLEEKGVTYEKDGALWLKSSQFGDEKDRVLVTSEEARGRREPTYITPDIAHHIDVLSRGYAKRINILGADHHGYVKRLLAAMDAAGLVGKVDIILLQFVRLFKDGREVRMSKRAGTYVTLDELLDAVGKDVARFFFLMYAPDSHIDFNLDLARERSNKNPVFYVQYAHARMSNILEKAGDQKPEAGADFSLLTSKEELRLIKHLAGLPELVEEISLSYQVQRLTIYAITLADLFHKFYETHRVLNAENEQVSAARLALVEAAKNILAQTLKLMGISAPQRM